MNGKNAGEADGPISVAVREGEGARAAFYTVPSGWDAPRSIAALKEQGFGPVPTHPAPTEPVVTVLQATGGHFHAPLGGARWYLRGADWEQTAQAVRDAGFYRGSEG